MFNSHTSGWSISACCFPRFYTHLWRHWTVSIMRVNWSITYLSFQGLFFLRRKSYLAPWLNKNQKKELYSLLKEGLINNKKGTILWCIAFIHTNFSHRAKWHFCIGKEWSEHRLICLLVVILTRTVPVRCQVICVCLILCACDFLQTNADLWQANPASRTRQKDWCKAGLTSPNYVSISSRDIPYAGALRFCWLASFVPTKST